MKEMKLLCYAQQLWSLIQNNCVLELIKRTFFRKWWWLQYAFLSKLIMKFDFHGLPTSLSMHNSWNKCHVFCLTPSCLTLSLFTKPMKFIWLRNNTSIKLGYLWGIKKDLSNINAAQAGISWFQSLAWVKTAGPYPYCNSIQSLG